MKTLMIPLMLLLACQCLAVTYYVNSANGSDDNPGTETAPFQNFRKIAQIPIVPGDTVAFARGTSYSNDYFMIDSSGTADQPITFTAYGTGSAPEFSHDGKEFVFRIDGSYVTLSNLKILNAQESGVILAGVGCRVENCEITGVGLGINIYPSAIDARIYGNDIHDLHMVKNTSETEDDDSGAVAINITAGGCDIAWNHIARCAAQSYDYGEDGGAFEIYSLGDVSNVAIHHNWCDHNSGVLEIGADQQSHTVANVFFYYNACVENGGWVSIHLDGHYGSTIANLHFDNNTVYDHSRNGNPWLLNFGGDLNQNNVTLTNNIFYYDGFSAFTNRSGIGHSHNLYYSPSGMPIGLPLSSGEQIGDPRFVTADPYSGNFNLQAASPAVNGGTNLGYSTDRNGSLIIGVPDLGAYESPY